MFAVRKSSPVRVVMHGLAILGLVLAAAANASPAYAAAPPNNDIGNAVKITTSAFAAYIPSVSTATTAATDPGLSCVGGSQGKNSVWYSFVPAASGEAQINTIGSSYDTVLAVFKNNPSVPGGLIELGCNNNAGGLTSALTLPLRGGVRYYIEVVRKTGTTASSYKMNLQYQFSQKHVVWSDLAGVIWDGSKPGVFTYTTGWQDSLFMGTNNGNLRVSNKKDNTAVLYFDGGGFDLVYALGPQMGGMDVLIDNAYVATLGEGNATYLFNQVWSSPPLSDGVHKLTLVHASGIKVNFDYVKIYAFPDGISPARITSLSALADTSTGGRVILKWKAPGDDKNVGTATKYQLQYFTGAVAPDCIADWGSGSSYVQNLPAPAVAGAQQQLMLNGLVPGLRYYFCIAAEDEVGNLGIPSNLASAVPTAGVLYGPGTYDDKHPGWIYSGNWKLVSDPDARYKTLHYSLKPGNSASFYFTGSQFVFTYVTVPAGAKMDVYIDDVLTTTIDQYTYYRNAFYYTSPMLVNGPHLVRFVQNGTGRVYVDQLHVNNVVDGGPPDPITDLAAAPGANDGEVDLSWTAPGDDAGVGKAKKYEVRYSSTPINNLVDWSYAQPAAGILAPPQAGGSLESMTVIGLTPGARYHFAVRAFDNAWYDVLSNSVQSSVQYSGAYAPAGPYQENNAIWSYNGSWFNGIDAKALGGRYRVLTKLMPGSSATFWFTGTGFRLTFAKADFYGRLDVRLDGRRAGTIYQNSDITSWKQNWERVGLALGNHVVEFRLVGDKANIDAIRIFP